MARAQQNKIKKPTRGLLVRPLDALFFLLPLILFYEIASFTRQDRVIAFDLLHGFIELFGQIGVWAPGLLVIVILFSMQIASGEPWKISWKRVGMMYLEAIVLAGPLLALSWTIPIAAAETVPTLDLMDQLATGIGAGIYEELVFRLILISMISMIGADLLRLEKGAVAAAAVILSSFMFAAHHHQPIGNEPFELIPFVFRMVAGVYLAIIFWYRGYGAAAGCHAAYNALLVMSDRFFGL